MSAVTEHLEQRGSAFEVLPHRQAYTSTDEARALGIDAGEVLKTLAVRTGPGYALAVIPASCRLDLHLVREALADHQARLAREEELARDFPGYQLGALPALGALLGSRMYVDPEVLEHDIVVFAAGTQTESVRMGTRELFGGEQITTVPLIKQADQGSDDPISRRRAAQQDGRRRAPQRRNRLRTGDPHRSQRSALTTPVAACPGIQHRGTTMVRWPAGRSG